MRKQIIELVEKLEPYITLVQSNTDGILFIPHDKTACEFIIKDWERRTRMNMEVNVCKDSIRKLDCLNCTWGFQEH